MAEQHDHHDVKVKEELATSNKVVHALATELLYELNSIRRNIDIAVESIKEIEESPEWENVLNSFEGASKGDILNNYYALRRVLDTTKDFC